ncbi:THUMP domain-containing protein [Palaeococcus sp. (in: euryarchaeotes)]|uniref:THUMP domain-containing protein n=1 Tax=Palaeococcus sp. (in: euryarchaeotes) TaxID=2820298 RepID=UPI000F123926|nr:THUMP domain-containing protein [Palaeococcus sp. (in: euryarchaeotes)]MCD6559080.1 RNA-binding protein [Palaeococcus sp. (in: euryarchaeotes)]RLF78517.1 MAG: RNA-binding protein [Thermococci archaeon]
MTVLLVTCPNGREGDASLELEWALGDAKVKRTKWKGVLLCFTRIEKGESLKRIKEFETSAIFKVIPIDTLVESSKEVIIECGFKVATERIKEGDSFAVRCKKRGGKIKSEKEIERELGARIKEGLNATVNLSNPRWLVLVEILGKKTGISVLKTEEVLKKEVSC